MSVVCKGRLDGTFEGWRGDTVFRFTNGQIWQQARYAYRYKYRYRPEALITKEGGRFFLQVKGMKDRIQVHRLS
jgi:hypothetical protein